MCMAYYRLPWNGGRTLWKLVLHNYGAPIVWSSDSLCHLKVTCIYKLYFTGYMLYNIFDFLFLKKDSYYGEIVCNFLFISYILMFKMSYKSIHNKTSINNTVHTKPLPTQAFYSKLRLILHSSHYIQSLIAWNDWSFTAAKFKSILVFF
jgi:hypothetical protein